MSDQQVATRHDGGTSAADTKQLAVSDSLAIGLARAEIDQKIATARAMPRSVTGAIQDIIELATYDEKSAADCGYAVPRGGQMMEGPSIRLAEIVASAWGNCADSARVVHVDRHEKYVEAEGKYHDLQTNRTTTMLVKRSIADKQGRLFKEDLIIVTGNAACSIARRNAIIGGIPSVVWRKGYDAAKEVIRGDIKTLASRRAAALKAFGMMGVTPDRLFAALEVPGEADITLDHLVTLNGLRNAIKNGDTTVEEAFPEIKPTNGKGGRPKDLGEAIDKLVGGAGNSFDPVTGEYPKTDDSNATANKERLAAVEKDIADRGKQTDEAASKSAGSITGDPVVTSGKESAAANSADAAAAVAASQGPHGDAGSASAPLADPASSNARQRPTDAAGAPAAIARADTPAERDAALLVNLMAEGAARAAAGKSALLNFLNGIEEHERKLIPVEAKREWHKIAAAVSAGA